MNQWRASTLAIIHREAETRLRDETESLITTLTARILHLLDSLLQPSPTPSPPTAPNESHEIDPRAPPLTHHLLTSLSLSRLLSIQRAQFHLSFPTILPHQRTLFDPLTMEDVGGVEDEEGLENREISCVVFPGLVKMGDESGGGLGVYRNVVKRARVLCREEG